MMCSIAVGPWHPCNTFCFLYFQLFISKSFWKDVIMGKLTKKWPLTTDPQNMSGVSQGEEKNLIPGPPLDGKFHLVYLFLFWNLPLQIGTYWFTYNLLLFFRLDRTGPRAVWWVLRDSLGVQLSTCGTEMTIGTTGTHVPCVWQMRPINVSSPNNDIIALHWSH